MKINSVSNEFSYICNYKLTIRLNNQLMDKFWILINQINCIVVDQICNQIEKEIIKKDVSK